MTTSLNFDRDFKVILASNSPRRSELLSTLNIPFEIKVLKGINEDYPQNIATIDVARYIAENKAQQYYQSLKTNDLIITADTVVIVDNQILGKPSDKDDAIKILKLLSDKTHLVVTGVCLKKENKTISFKDITEVTFKKLLDNEIDFYVNHFKPFDKAGAYGIQEWIGCIGVTGIKGSYFNVMGLPIHKVYQQLSLF